MNPTDIVFLSHSASLDGGAEKSLLELLLYLKAKRVSTHVILPSEGAFATELASHRIAYSIVYCPWWIYGVTEGNRNSTDLLYSSDENRVAFSQVFNLLSELKPKLCVTNTVVTPILAYVASMTHVRHAWVLREFIEYDNLIKIGLGKEIAAKTIDTLSDKVFVNSHAMQAFYSKLLGRSDIDIIYPFVSRPSQKSRSTKVFLRNNSKKIILVGNIDPAKGQFDAVRAIDILVNKGYDIELAIVGKPYSTVYMDDMRSFAEKKSLDKHVHFLGFQKNVHDLLRDCDIALVTSKNEAFGRVTVEAIMNMKPVIGTSTGGTKEIITKTGGGLLYEPSDYKQLAHQIETLLKDTDLYTGLVRNGSKEVEQYCSSEKVHMAFYSYYTKACKMPFGGLSLRPVAGLLANFTHMTSDNQATIALLQKQYESALKELGLIKNSRTWRLRTRIRDWL